MKIRATAAKYLFWVKPVSLCSRTMQVLRESSLEGGVCWPVAAKEVQGSREMQSQTLPIHPVLLSPSHPLSLSACLPGFYKLSLRLPRCSPCPEHSFTHEEASTFCLCQTNYSRSPSDPASASCTRTSHCSFGVQALGLSCSTEPGLARAPLPAL